MYLRKTNFILLYLLLIGLPLFSQKKVNIYNEPHGLKPTSTSHVAQCNQGYIWTLNDSLIYRFDGEDFWQYSPSPPPPPPPDSLSESGEKFIN
ncbi:MAG: hypothetical protein AB8F94_29900 [Saprospiraceae bacterium]